MNDCERLGFEASAVEAAEECEDDLALREEYRGMVHDVQNVNAITAIIFPTKVSHYLDTMRQNGR